MLELFLVLIRATRDGAPVLRGTTGPSTILLMAALLSSSIGRAASFHPLQLPKPSPDQVETGPSGLPAGEFSAGAVPFNIQSPLRLIGIEDARQGRLFPAVIPGIAVGRKATVIHLLHGVDGPEKDGVPLASLVLRYAGGQQQVIRLAYGVHARSQMPVRRESSDLHDPNSKIAWQGTNRLQGREISTARIYHSAIPNPLAAETIVSVDLVSLFSRATPFLLAMTVEEGPDGTRILEPRQNRVVRNSREFDDVVYHDKLTIRVQDSDGKPNTAAEASLTISDTEGSYLFGRATADSAGLIRLSVPPQHAVGLTVVVHAAGRLPFVYSTPKGSVGRALREIAAVLEKGTEVGGIVRSATGDVVPGATVAVYHLRQDKPREYTRLDYDTVTTDPAGKWRSAAVPRSLDGFQFSVAHPDFRPRVYSVGAVGASESPAGAFALRAEDLRAGTAVAALQPAIQLTGTIRGAADKPLAGVELRLASARNPDSSGDELTTRSDAGGRFKFSVMNAGSYSIVAMAEGYSPKAQLVALRDGPEQQMDFVLSSGRPFRGRVTDQAQQPIAGARVRLETWNDLRLLKFEAVTDEKGTFTWENAPEGQLRFYLSAPDHSSTTYSISGGNSEQRFTLRRLSGVRGTVVDAETRKPIPDFSVYRGRAYNPTDPIRWERYNTFRGRNGEYNVRLVDASSSGRTAVLVEAPGYMPAASEAFNKPGAYTNNFELKKARGVSGRVLAMDGTPVAGANIALLEPAENAYLRAGGELQRNSDAGLQMRTDRNGEFQFSPRLDPHTLIATHDKGFAELRVTNAATPVTITLQPWARVVGSVKFPPPSGGHALRLHNTFYRYTDDSRESQPLSLYLSTDAAEDGSFQFNRVPPGERRVALYYSVKVGDSTRSANSHGVPLTLLPGQTTNIVIGGTGRPVVGRVTVSGGDPEDVDWKRDFHTLTASRPIKMNLPALDFSKARTPEQQQELWAQQRKAEAAFWRTPEGMAHEREQRSYILQFDTNGNFRVDDVPPGRYSLSISPTDPTREDYSYEQIGNLQKEVVIPEVTPGQPAAPFDLGSLEITVRATMRIGKRAPRFTVTSFEGREVKLEDFRGKHVLIDFWATWAGSRSLDLQNLKTIRERYAKDDRLVMIGMNLDHVRQQAEQHLKTNPLEWLQCFGGTWNESPLRVSYGLRGMPDAVLIDPEGKIAGLNLRGSGLLRAVQRALGDPKAGPP